MSLLDVENLSHSFGDNMLFRNAGFTLNKGEHLGIVGQNGTGKSTLIKICTKQVIPDTGSVLWQPGVTIGYLDQYARIDQNTTMEDFLKSAYEELYTIEADMIRFYEQAVSQEPGALKQAARCQEILEAKDFYSIDTKINQVTSGLGLRALGLECPIEQMSGGQRAKVILAKLLLEKPDVLLLDEPTNFLDKDHVTWLAEYLSGIENAYMVISHDFDFLEIISTCICDIDNETLTKYYGSYTGFLKKKTLLREDYVRQYTAQQREIKKTEEFIRKNIAGRKSKMARGRQKQLDRMDKMDALEQKEIKPHFDFPCLPLTDTIHLQTECLSIGYGSTILSNLKFTIHGGQKVVLTGFNGIGKSTLLKTLTGQIPTLGGDYQFSPQVRLGCFEQDLKWENKEETPMQIVSDAYPALTVKELRKHLARCGISSKHALQDIGTLSGGEQAKVKLCLLILNPSNFLILDEPTNHLDAHAKNALKDALKVFPGTVLLVSHEASFYEDWAQRIINIETSL